jgi:hypothetical protein
LGSTIGAAKREPQVAFRRNGTNPLAAPGKLGPIRAETGKSLAAAGLFSVRISFLFHSESGGAFSRQLAPKRGVDLMKETR